MSLMYEAALPDVTTRDVVIAPAVVLVFLLPVRGIWRAAAASRPIDSALSALLATP